MEKNAPNKHITYVGLARVSTHKQGRNGESIETQCNFIESYCRDTFKLVKLASKGFYSGFKEREEASLESGLCDSINWFVLPNNNFKNYSDLYTVLINDEIGQKMFDAIITTIDLKGDIIKIKLDQRKYYYY